ncbi:MAG: hypothetical protein M0Q94_16130 [Candidatus Cloacimonetes bacterium]|nr:hypothetical protein [Candidatus Cloacimonadota bacterium]
MEVERGVIGVPVENTIGTFVIFNFDAFLFMSLDIASKSSFLASYRSSKMTQRMMYNNSNSRSRGGGMAFILGETVRAQIYQLDGPLIARINHAALLFSEVTALLNAGDRKVAQGDRKHISKILEAFNAFETKKIQFLLTIP